MADKKDKDQDQELSLKGCYGEQVAYDGLLSFLEDAFASNRDAEAQDSNERFATCIWGHAGCVLEDTEIEVRKIGDGKHHKIIIVNPKPE